MNSYHCVEEAGQGRQRGVQEAGGAASDIDKLEAEIWLEVGRLASEDEEIVMRNLGRVLDQL